MSKTYTKTRTLVECALMIAIGTVLSNIKFFTLPNGGSITLLSMLPFVLVSFRHGVKWGLFTGLVNACLQMLLGCCAVWHPRSLTARAQRPKKSVLSYILCSPAGPKNQQGDFVAKISKTC